MELYACSGLPLPGKELHHEFLAGIGISRIGHTLVAMKCCRRGALTLLSQASVAAHTHRSIIISILLFTDNSKTQPRTKLPGEKLLSSEKLTSPRFSPNLTFPMQDKF